MPVGAGDQIWTHTLRQTAIFLPGLRAYVVENPTRQPIDEATRNLIDKLLLERLALANTVRLS